jgi:hypothetical protein
MDQEQQRVVLGMDPHKRLVTIEVMTADETVLGGGRFGTDIDGFGAMRRYVSRFPERIWAIEGCSGIGRHVAHRLLAAGEEVVDLPPKLSARVRVFATGQGRKTNATDAHSVALVGVRMAGLRPVVDDEQLEVLRLLVDRRRALGEEHTRKVSQLHALLLELIPGGAKKDLSAAQAKKLLAGVRPRDVVGKTRKRVAAELVADLERIHARKKAADQELRELVAPTGTAPIDASSGDLVRHRLCRGGNRQINRVLHTMATVQLRNPTEGRGYYDRKKTTGKISMETMRCLKRRLSDTVYRTMLDDLAAATRTGPGGNEATTLTPARPAHNLNTGSSDKPLQDPSGLTLRPPSPRGLDTEGSHERAPAAGRGWPRQVDLNSSRENAKLADLAIGRFLIASGIRWATTNRPLRPADTRH